MRGCVISCVISVNIVPICAIFDIWINETVNSVRKKLLNNDRNYSPCDKCDVNGSFTGEDFDYEGTIEEIVDKAQKARKDGLLSLEADLSNMKEGFFKNGIELAINERESSRLRTFLNLEMNNISSRHIAGQELFLYMGSYAPAFGMLGTVLGLIIMMNNFITSTTTYIN